MSLSLEELREKHIAMPGEEMLCPGCGAVLLRFTGHTFRNAETTPFTDRRWTDIPERYTLYCAACGTGATRAVRGQGPFIEDAKRAEMLIRSGSWTGWRALGGE